MTGAEIKLGDQIVTAVIYHGIPILSLAIVKGTVNQTVWLSNNYVVARSNNILIVEKAYESM